MKKAFLAVAATLLFCSLAMAQSVNLPYLKNARPYYSLVTLVSGTTTGAGTAVPLGIPMSRFTCQVTWGGTAATNTVTKLEGSLDGTGWTSLVSRTTTTTLPATPDIFTSATFTTDVLYIRGNYVSKSGGDATTAVTMKCMALPN